MTRWREEEANSLLAPEKRQGNVLFFLLLPKKQCKNSPFTMYTYIFWVQFLPLCLPLPKIFVIYFSDILLLLVWEGMRADYNGEKKVCFSLLLHLLSFPLLLLFSRERERGRLLERTSKTSHSLAAWNRGKQQKGRVFKEIFFFLYMQETISRVKSQNTKEQKVLMWSNYRVLIT